MSEEEYLNIELVLEAMESVIFKWNSGERPYKEIVDTFLRVGAIMGIMLAADAVSIAGSSIPANTQTVENLGNWQEAVMPVVLYAAAHLSFENAPDEVKSHIRRIQNARYN